MLRVSLNQGLQVERAGKNQHETLKIDLGPSTP